MAFKKTKSLISCVLFYVLFKALEKSLWKKNQIKHHWTQKLLDPKTWWWYLKLELHFIDKKDYNYYVFRFQCFHPPLTQCKKSCLHHPILEIITLQDMKTKTLLCIILKSSDNAVFSYYVSMLSNCSRITWFPFP